MVLGRGHRSKEGRETCPLRNLSLFVVVAFFFSELIKKNSQVSDLTYSLLP